MHTLLTRSLFAVALLLGGNAAAEDIFLYSNNAAGASGEPPTILLVWDNAGGTNASAPSVCSYADEPGVAPSLDATKAAGMEQCAMVNALLAVKDVPELYGKVKVGLMLFNGNSQAFPNNGNDKCGYLMAEPRVLDENNINALVTTIKSFQRSGNASAVANGPAVGDTLAEAWAMLNGRSSSCSGVNYAQYNAAAAQCRNSVILYIGNAFTGGSAGDENAGNVKALLQAELRDEFGYATGSPNYDNFTRKINVTGASGSMANSWAPEWARLMNRVDVDASAAVDRNITTYTISVGSNAPKVSYHAAIADAGGGKTYSVETQWQDLVKAILNVFSEVQAVNSVFTSATLPVSAHSQGTYLNQVFVAMFRPDEQAGPRWPGNLKQYQMGFDAGGNLVLTDATEDPEAGAVVSKTNPNTGMLSPSARSFWTTNTPGVAGWPADGFWRNSPAGEGSSQSLDAPDGDLVEKGGAAQMARTGTDAASNLTATYANAANSNHRKLLTCNAVDDCSATLPLFRMDNSGLATTLATVTGGAPVASDLINWVRGHDRLGVAHSGVEASKGPCDLVNGVPVGADCPVTIRPSLHGDVLHSRPAVVNYGGDYGVVVFYGANDGVFRAINGNQSESIVVDNVAVRAGGELWGFVAPEFFDRLGRLYNNSPKLALPGVVAPDAEPKGYFFDGSPTVLQDGRAAGSAPTAGKVYLYMTARRGGRMIYAFDVTDPTSPEFLWKKSNEDIGELGQTWSQPKIAQLRGRDTPVLIMGAGYDPAEDSEPAPAADSMGRGIIMLDAQSGDLVWAALASCTGLGSACTTVADMNRAMPADITLVDRNGDGFVDRLYAGDVGATVWRVDLMPSGHAVDADPATFKVTKFATLGGSGNSARKLFYPPELIVTDQFDALAVITGDREHPLYTDSTTAGLAYNVENRFYLLVDRHTDPVVPDGAQPIVDDGTSLIDVGAAQAGEAVTVDLGNVAGYFFDLRQGEKGVNAPVAVAGKVYFGTNQPSTPEANSCSANLGIARAYTVDFVTGVNQSREFVGGGMPPSPVHGLVTIGGVTVPFIIGATGPSPFDPSIPPIDLDNSRKRTYWYER